MNEKRTRDPIVVVSSLAISLRGLLWLAISWSITTGAAAQELAWTELFDGHSLAGWSGDSKLWQVEDGVIVGEGPAGGPVPRSDYLWHESTWNDFVLEAHFRLQGGNSGIQYRSRRASDGEAIGYQADLDAANQYSGMLYESRGRGIAVPRGEVATLAADGTRDVVGFHPDAESAVERLSDGNWHQLRIIAHGSSIRHEIDSTPVCAFTDGAPDAVTSGRIGLQIHGGGPMKIEWKSIRARPWQPLDGDPVLDCARNSTPPEAQPVHWIWAQGNSQEQVELVRSFEVDQPVEASLTMSGDNHFVAFLDGKQILKGDDWSKPARAILSQLTAGPHQLRVRCINDGGPAALAGILGWTEDDGTVVSIVTDSQWRHLEDGTEKPVRVIGDVGAGTAPWGDIGLTFLHLVGIRSQWAGTAPWGDIGLTPGGSVTRWSLPQGFQAEILHHVDKADGSWVCIASEGPGKFITSPQRGVLKRVVIDEEGVTVTDCASFGDAQGLLLVDGDLWVHVAGHRKDRGGLWILSDPDGDGFFDQEKRLSAMGPGGEHGVHALVRGPDGDVWTVVGNHIDVPESLLTRDRYRHWQEDLILPRLWDPNGHAVGHLAPAGQVLRIDPKTLEWERVAGGFRNSYDLAFHHDGSLFTYDADMEWDIGTPWYRSPRVVEVVSGGEAGWRGGDGKWPDGIPDAVMPSVETDLSSPTGVSSGLEGNFPGRWRHAIYIADWAYGRILAYFPQEHGAGWRGRAEPFAAAAAFNVADMVFGDDGALYGVTGGRGTASTLFRIRAEGDDRDPMAAPTTDRGRQARALKKQLETGHLQPAEDLLTLSWSHLSHRDQAIGYAARVAIEQFPPARWREWALDPASSAGSIGLLTLARVGEKIDRDALLERLCDLPPASDRRQLLEQLRVATVAIARLGDPAGATRQRLLARFDNNFPGPDLAENRLRGDLLVRLSAPDLTARILDWMDAKADAAEGLAALRLLRFMKPDETQQQRIAAALKVIRGRSGGNSLRGFADQMVRQLDDGSGVLTTPELAPPVLPDPVTRWTESTLLTAVRQPGGDAGRGQAAYHKALCSRCHRFQQIGGGAGPDLTGVRARFSNIDLVRAILTPSRDVSDQYHWSIVTTEDDLAVGRILRKDADSVVLNTDPFGYQPLTLSGKVISIEASPDSPMPNGLIDTLDEGQVRDLWAYLGNSSRPGSENSHLRKNGQQGQ